MITRKEQAVRWKKENAEINKSPLSFRFQTAKKKKKRRRKGERAGKA